MNSEHPSTKNSSSKSPHSTIPNMPSSQNIKNSARINSKSTMNSPPSSKESTPTSNMKISTRMSFQSRRDVPAKINRPKIISSNGSSKKSPQKGS